MKKLFTNFLKLIDYNKSDRNIKLILEELKLNPNDCYMLYQAAKTYYTNKEYHLASNYFDKFYKKTNIKTYNFYTDGVLLCLYNCIQTKEFEKGLKVIDDNLDILSNRCDFYFTCAVFFTDLVAYDTQKYIHFFDNIELCYLKALEIGEDSNFDGVEGTGSYLASHNLSVFYELIGDFNKSNYYKNFT